MVKQIIEFDLNEEKKFYDWCMSIIETKVSINIKDDVAKVIIKETLNVNELQELIECLRKRNIHSRLMTLCPDEEPDNENKLLYRVKQIIGGLHV